MARDHQAHHSHTNDAWDQPLWETFVCTTLGLEVPVLASLPRRNQRAPALCGCKKQGMDLYGNHNVELHTTLRRNQSA